MSDNGTSSEQVTSKLIEMGFDKSAVIKALEAVGPSLDDAIEHILNGHYKNCKSTASSSKCSTSCSSTLGKKVYPSTSSVGQKRQSTILDHFRTPIICKRSKANAEAGIMISGSALLPTTVIDHRETYPISGFDPKPQPKALPDGGQLEVDIKSGWELKVNSLLQKHFGYLSLKNFQKEALSTWLARQDCLVLAATGSGKSLCFQIPALLTGQIVVVISPLISLMHDQCSKLSKHGISACYLGSGQPDRSVELKAMRGTYNIIYVCPETLLRLIKPMQKLAESHGIALFAIDEVHCVSKWGHDFRPDYRRLSVLRENFSTENLKFLKFDIPLMALTATATTQVQEDILQSLHMSAESKIVRTSLFRPNLQFLVKHSKTSSQSSYGRDFRQLIDIYNGSRKIAGKEKTTSFHELDNKSDNSASSSMSLASDTNPSYNIEDDELDEDEVDSGTKNVSHASREKEMSVEYLENDVDVFLSANDWDVACGEFHEDSFQQEGFNKCGSAEAADQSSKSEKRVGQLLEPLEQGPTIIYVPTRKETLSIAKFLCGFGVKAAAYNASLPKSHLRRVHKEFHENVVEVVVATIAFGMGIDKLNVRRIIHYGWPQSLEAYYQEAGRAGRDGKLADCILYADLSRVPTLLPSKRSEDQTRRAYQMLSDCFRYGMNTSCCRAKILVEYFGEHFSHENCLACDVCVNGPPIMQNLKEEANVLMQVIAAYDARSAFEECSHDDVLYTETKPRKFMEKPNLRTFVSKIREQSKKFLETDLLWWRGFARILENKGFIRESDNKIHVQIKFPEPTNHGLEFLQSENDQTFNVYPEADMLLSMEKPKSYCSFSDWGKGWADPEIRRQRLESKRSSGKQGKRQKSKKRKSRKSYGGFTTARSRLSAKLSKKR